MAVSKGKMGKGGVKVTRGKPATLREIIDLRLGGKSPKNAKITRRPGGLTSY